MLTFLLDYGGRLHPLLIHFPIALLLAAAAGEVVQLWRPSPVLREVVHWALLAGAAGAVLAAGSGWLFALQVRRPPDLRPYLFWHRWLGVALAVVAVTAAWLGRPAMADSPCRTWAQRLLVWTAAALVLGVGHLGAALVWGADFFAPRA